jgi:hypothetical protein
MLVVYKLFTNRRAFCGCCISVLVCTYAQQKVTLGTRTTMLVTQTSQREHFWKVALAGSFFIKSRCCAGGSPRILVNHTSKFVNK